MTLQDVAREAEQAFDTAERPGRGLTPSEGQAISDMLETFAGIDEGENTDPALLARLASAARDAGSEYETTSYVRLRDDAPDWISNLVRRAHGDFLPEDWRYACIRAAVSHIAGMDAVGDPEEEEHDFADGYVDVYTASRLDWLGSNLSRQGYVDEAIDNGIASLDGGIASAIGTGQYLEAREVYSLVLDSLRERLEEIVADDDDDDESMRKFIADNRGQLIAAIRLACPNCGPLDDDDIAEWIGNDVGLYEWARSEGVKI